MYLNIPNKKKYSNIPNKKKYSNIPNKKKIIFLKECQRTKNRNSITLKIIHIHH